MEYDHDSARLFLCSVSTVWSWLGGDLWLEIFKRSSIKTLSQFRCVCKSYNSLISSPFFINLHYSFTSSSSPPTVKPYLLVKIGDRNRNSSTLYLPQESHVEHQVHFPFRFRDGFSCADVIHGVICVSCSLDSSFDSTILWNPAIRKYVSLPRLGYPLGLEPVEDPEEDDFNREARFSSSAIGFGYNSSKNDFKVVRFWIHSYGIPSPPTYEVYSVQEGVWRAGIIDINIASHGLDPEKNRTSCFVNGTIHWLLSTPVEEGSYVMIHSVLLFDCEHEEFKTMELPLEIYKADIKTWEEFRAEMELEGHINPPDYTLDSMTELEVLEFGGMLSVLVRRDWEHFVELWVMEENGDGSKWEKLYRIHDGEKSYGIDVCRPSLGNIAPYGPNQWIKFRNNHNTFNHILDAHVYEESMFLMDDTKARAYTMDEIVRF